MRESMDDEFFIGYAPPRPPRLTRFVKRVVIAVACGTAAWGVTLAGAHHRLEGGTFDFGRPHTFSGIVVEHPYPAMRLDGEASMFALLVAPGKHGADAFVRGLDGRRATLKGTRIQRGTHTMIELEPGSIATDTSSVASAPAGSRASDSVALRGEIVDSKCFLGVMVPGSGKTHRECAALCLRGGIPPAIHVEDRAGRSAVMLLTGPSGEPVAEQGANRAGEAIDMTGTVTVQSGWLTLRTDPASWRPVPR
jgi:hypothetical protein